MNGFSKEEILEALNFVEQIHGTNAVEYIILKDCGISRTKVIQFLKEADRYNDFNYIAYENSKTRNIYSEEIRNDISDFVLKNYSFLDMQDDFAYEQYSEDYSYGYELASEFLISRFCEENEFKAFMKKLLSMEKIPKEYKKEMLTFCKKFL